MDTAGHNMTAPTTHDTRTVILTDTQINDASALEAARYRKRNRSAGGSSIAYEVGHGHGMKDARSIYEPHVAKLEAEIAEAKRREILWQQYVSLLIESERMLLPMFSVHGGRFPNEMIQRGQGFRVALGITTPLPAAPTQGGGEE